MDRVQVLARKHCFGKNDDGRERYETMTVAGSGGKFRAELFGTEQEKIWLTCGTMEDGRAMIAHRFREAFPNHVCSECCRGWRPLKSDTGTNTVQ